MVENDTPTSKVNYCYSSFQYTQNVRETEREGGDKNQSYRMMMNIDPPKMMPLRLLLILLVC